MAVRLCVDCAAEDGPEDHRHERHSGCRQVPALLQRGSSAGMCVFVHVFVCVHNMGICV